MTPQLNRRLLEEAISEALAIGRVDDAPYVAIAYLRRCLDAAPMISPAKILRINGFVTDPAGETWCTALRSLADFWSRKMCEQEAAQRAASIEGIPDAAMPEATAPALCGDAGRIAPDGMARTEASAVTGRRDGQLSENGAAPPSRGETAAPPTAV